MGDEVNTNVEVLHEIKNSLVRFQERIAPLQGELTQVFQEIDEQLADSIKRKMRQIEEHQKGSAKGRTDSFVCDICGGRIMLKIGGDTTHCREAGCNGTLHRVYTDRSYSSTQRNNDKEELERLRRIVNSYNQQKADFLQLFSSFFLSEADDVNQGVTSLASCISILEQYLGTDISMDVGYDKKETKKMLNASATNSLERAEDGAVEVPLMSDLSDAFISKFPQKRRSAVHTAYAKAPDYIVESINQHSGQLNYIRNTQYEQDSFGNFILNEYGMRIKESCHYSQDRRYIAMHDEMTDAEYADVIQHELGHFIDDILGRPSTEASFLQAFSNTASRYSADTLDGRRLLNDMLDDAFSTGAAYDRNITDIISALTMNNPIVINRFDNEGVAYYRHREAYWKRRKADGTSAGMREKDSFANVFAIETANYRISLNFVERWFPELSVALRHSVGGAE